jgi:hypothetical protein
MAVVVGYKSSVRQGVKGVAFPTGLVVARGSFQVQSFIYQRCRRPMEIRDLVVGPGPGFPEEVETGSLALGAGAMPGRQSRGLVKEEQLGVATGRHDGAVSVLEGEKADDPPPPQERTADPAVIVMQATPVAHQRPACGGGDESAKRGYAILPRHSSSVGFCRFRSRLTGAFVNMIPGTFYARDMVICGPFPADL